MSLQITLRLQSDQRRLGLHVLAKGMLGTQRRSGAGPILILGMIPLFRPRHSTRGRELSFSSSLFDDDNLSANHLPATVTNPADSV